MPPGRDVQGQAALRAVQEAQALPGHLPTAARVPGTTGGPGAGPDQPIADDPTGAGCPLAPCDPTTEECPADPGLPGDPEAGAETEPEPPPLVSDGLGIHAEEALLSTPNGRHVRRCRVSRTRGGGFYSELAAGWQFSSARVRPCRPGRLSGGWTDGARFRVIREVTGELICKGLWFGYGSSTWYETTQGWVWSGATATARWVRC